MPEHDADFRELNAEQLSQLRNQLKSFVAGADAGADGDVGDISVIAAHNSHDDQDGWA